MSVFSDETRLNSEAGDSPKRPTVRPASAPFSDDRSDRDLGPADHETQTRMGPRPVPSGKPVGRKGRRLPMRRVIPSGDVSPDGQRNWPRPSLTAKIITWGGAAIGATALAAGTVLASRKLADALSSDDRHDMDRAYNDPNRYSSRAATRTPRQPERDYSQRGYDGRDTQGYGLSRAPQPRRESFAAQVDRTARSLQSIASSIGTAMVAFESVSGRANHIIDSFSETADKLRAQLAPRDEQHEAGRPAGQRPVGQPVPDLDGDPRRDDPTRPDIHRA